MGLESKNDLELIQASAKKVFSRLKMDGLSGISPGMNVASGALTVHAMGMQVAAHNVANVSTGDFLPQRATYATGSRGLGVELEAVRKQPVAMAMPEEIGGAFGGKRASGTELAKEIPQMISTQRAFEANAATIRVADEMFGSLLNTIA